MTPTQKEVINDPVLFAEHFLWIRDKEKQLVRLRYNKAQRHFLEHRTGRDLILKARQLGFSTAVQGEMFRRIVTSTRTTMTMAHDSETTQKLRRMADRFWEHCRFGNVQPERKYSNALLATYPEFDSSSIIATAGSGNAGRGDTYTDFHGSEVAFWPDAEKIVAGAMQGGNPDVVLESTPNGTQGYFYERCMEALDNNSVWTLHFYPWWWDDAYRVPVYETLKYTDEEAALAEKHGLDPEQIQWRRGKQKELKHLFIQEYPEDPISCFLTSGTSYFGDLSKAFCAPADPEYNWRHKYFGGLDFGQSVDYTVLQIIDATTKEHVYQLRMNRLPWADMRRRIKKVYEYWHLPYILAEANSIGGVNIEEFINEGVNIQRFETTNASKGEIMAGLHEWIHDDGGKLLNNPVLKHEMMNFVATQTSTGLWRLAAANDGHDDTVIGLALGVSAAANAISWDDLQDLGSIEDFESRWA